MATKHAAAEAEPTRLDADAAKAAYFQPAVEQAVAAQAEQEAARRQDQDRLATWARALERTLSPLVEALEVKPPPPVTVPERERQVGLDLTRALDHVFEQRQELVALKGKATAWLPRLIAALEGPLLEPAALRAHERDVSELHGALTGLDAKLAAERRRYGELATVAAKSGAVVDAYRRWAEEASQ